MPDTAFDPAAINDPASTAAQLREHVAAIRTLIDERKQVADAIALRYATAASEGFDKDVLKVVVKRLDSDQGELALADDTLRLYESWLRGENPEDAALPHAVATRAGRRGTRSKRADH